MKKTKIQSVEEAVSVYEESSIIRGTATMNGDAKTNNKYVPVQNRALVFMSMIRLQLYIPYCRIAILM